jgi:membrane protease YdiL (CAAX protease family)
VCVVLLTATITCLALPWVDLSWWKIFRRSASIASALSLWFCITRLERRSIRSYGFAAGQAGGWWFGLLLGVSALAVMLGVGLATGLCRIAVTPDHVKLWRTLLGFAPAAVLVGVLEELVFRGYLLQHLLPWSRPAAVVATSALYSVVHLKSREWTFHTGMELGGLFLLGAVLSFSYLRTRQLYLAAGLHAALAYGARVNKLLIEFPDLSLSWLSGTSRLVNGLVGWLVLLGLSGIVWWRTRGVAEEG